MKFRIVLAVVGCLAVISCGKKQPGAQPARESAAPPVDSASTESLPASTVGETAATPAGARPPSTPESEAAAFEGAIHPFMTSQLRLFIQEKGRLPESFSEFSNAKMDSVPRPPPGMEYIIDANAQVVKVIRKTRK